MGTLKKIRAWTNGKMTYLTAGIGALSAISAWAAGTIEITALIAALLGSAALVFNRRGTATAQKSIDALSKTD